MAISRLLVTCLRYGVSDLRHSKASVTLKRRLYAMMVSICLAVRLFVCRLCRVAAAAKVVPRFPPRANSPVVKFLVVAGPYTWRP